MKEKLMYRIGHSNDTHRLVKGSEIILGGVHIPFDMKLDGHSDADVVYHAVSEAIIGALALGDLGSHFPDNDMQYKGMDSSYFVRKAYEMMDNQGYEINNIDILIYLEKPILVNYKPQMKENIANLLKTDVNNVNVKATRGEGLGFIGEMKGISCEAVCMLKLKSRQRL